MDTEDLNLVSYLTINNETREIADQACRNALNGIEDFKDRIEALELITDLPKYNFNINNYKQLSIIAKTGKAEEYVNIGDQVIVPWSPKNELSAFYNLPFDVVGINLPAIDPIGRTISNNIWLQSHYALTSIPFNGVSDNNAFYVPAENMEPGTYYFTAKKTIGSLIADENYCFTLTKEVPANGQLVFTRTSGSWTTTNNLSSWRVNSYNNGFESTPIETVMLENNQIGTKIGVLVQSSEYTTTGMNSINRIRYGHNRYSLSTIRQWCNGLEGNGLWWKPLDLFERCQYSMKTTQGFMAGLPESFINIVNPVQVITKLNTVSDDGTNNDDITIDNFFLPSPRQQNLTGISGQNEEELIWPYWIEYRKEVSKNIYYQYESHTSTASGVWIRSPLLSSETAQWYVTGTGSLATSSSYSSYRITPACVIY